MTAFRCFAAAAALAGIAALCPVSEAYAQAKQPPACAAITFRPVAPGMSDGEQEAGMYKSRFGTIFVKANVKAGQPDNYFVVVNNKKPEPIAAPPASIAECAKAKKLPAPAKLAGSCAGDGFRVLIDRAGGKRHLVLDARQGRTWQACSVGTA